MRISFDNISISRQDEFELEFEHSDKKILKINREFDFQRKIYQISFSVKFPLFSRLTYNNTIISTDLCASY